MKRSNFLLAFLAVPFAVGAADDRLRGTNADAGEPLPVATAVPLTATPFTAPTGPEAVSGPVPEPAAAPVVTGPAFVSAPEPLFDPAPEPAAAPVVTGPAFVSAPEPVSGPAPEPVAAAVVEPVAEPVPASVVEPAADPVTAPELVVESAAEPFAAGFGPGPGKTIRLRPALKADPVVVPSAEP